MNERVENPILLTMERIVTMHAQMTDDEKKALSLWERENVTGDGKYATSDWPGWRAVFDRLAH